MATDEVKQAAPYAGRNDDPRRQRLLQRLRRGPVVARADQPQGQDAGDGAAANLPPLPEPPHGPQHAQRYNTAAARARPLLDAADRTLAPNRLPPAIAATKAAYVKASTTLAADLQTPDYVKALASLALKEDAARTVLAEKGKLEAATRKKEQHESQSAA